MSSPTPLTSYRDTKKVYPASESSLALDAGIHAFAGGIACTGTNTAGGLTAGYGVTGRTSAYLVARGIFAQEVDNTNGAAGALTAPVDVGRFWLDNDTSYPCLRANIDGICYILDDHTVTMNASGTSIAGIIRDIGTYGVLVDIGNPFDSAITAEAASRAAIASNLALTTSGNGASRVGIYNSPAGQITATNVQDALMELIDGRRVALTASTGIGLISITLKMTKAGDLTGNTDLVLDATFGRIEIHAVKFVKTGTTGATGDTVQLINGTGSNAITEASSLTGVAADTAIVTGTLAAAYKTVDKGATLRLAGVKGSSGASCACVAYITALRVA